MFIFGNSIYIKIHPTFIPKNKNLTNRCFINEEKIS